MCIILTCEPNVRPDYELIETCFWNNPDGAGLMWVQDGRVQTSKGYTDEKDLWDMIQYVPKTSRLVIHMRIATSGGINTGTCHPFPICSDLDLLHEADVECDAAIAHNGVIAGMKTDKEKGISDTVEFVRSLVSPLYWTEGLTKSVRRRIKNAAPGNRFAVMTKDGKVYRLGSGWETVTKGIHASNSTWRWNKWLLWESTYSTYRSTSGKPKGGVTEWDKPDWVKTDSYWDDDEYDCGWGHGSCGTWMNLSEYEDAVNMCCPDNCPSRGSCLMYGPACDDVYDLVQTIMDEEEEGWETKEKEDEYAIV